MKTFINKMFVDVSKIIFSKIYDKKYLTGHWFDDVIGWKWCWRCFVDQKIFGYNRHIPFPVNRCTVVGKIENIEFDNDNIDNFWKNGCYYQCWNGKIIIGKGTWIAPNVGIITENHNIFNLNEHMKSKDVIIGENCWIGMNATILPGVVLGDNTIVGAGAVVTKSFVDGHCVIGGVPAKEIRELC